MATLKKAKKPVEATEQAPVQSTPESSPMEAEAVPEKAKKTKKAKR